ncbi:hypothetical protein KY320_03360 [Candidatus Woesearchaeota archaeon]|nr:hypothetical protein [Candidatus Woesearchaeota archaeon]
MNYQLTLTVDNSAVLKLLKPEVDRFKSTRASVELDSRDHKTIVNIKAKDAVALRSTTDSIIQLLKVYEKVSKIK